MEIRLSDLFSISQEAVLGHSKKGIEDTYNLHTYEKECAIWLQKWADYLDHLMH